MNEHHRPQDVGPPPIQNAGQGLPPQQPPPLAGQPAGQVVRVWNKGRFFPLLAAAFVLFFLMLSCWITVGAVVHHPKGMGFWIAVDAILAVIIVVCLVMAFRRKVTLTARDLIVQNLFRTRVLPLREIADLHIGWRRSRKRFRSTRVYADTSHDPSNDFLLLKLVKFLVRRLLPKPVRIELSGDGRVCRTKSFGWRPWEAMQEIAKTAKAAGSPIDLNATGAGPEGAEWVSERVRDARDRL